MDIKFLFIVGTPPRDVVDMQQIWRPQSKGYSSIMNNSAFEPRSVIMNPNASSFKLKALLQDMAKKENLFLETIT